MSQVNFDRATPSDRPSPSIWKTCPKNLLNETGTGVYRFVDFLGAPTGTLAAALDATMVSFGDALKIDADTDTVLSVVSGDTKGILQIETDGDDNDAAALYSQPFGRIVEGSGKELWFEARVAAGDVDADLGIFVGLAEEDAVDGTTTTARDVLDDDVGSNGLVAESVIGYILDNGDDNAFDAVYTKDDGTAVNPLTDVTNATAIDSDDRASVTDDALFKLGIHFDGRDKLKFFVDGVHVATQTVDSTIDQSHDYCAVVGIKTGAGAAEHVRVDWVAYAYNENAGG